MFEKFLNNKEFTKEDIERLFEFLEKDKFSSLSLDEQNELIDIIIDISNDANNNGNNVKGIGMIKNSIGELESIDIQGTIDEIGYESFRDSIREAILDNNLQITSVSLNEIKDLVEKMKNGTITKEEQLKLDIIMNDRINNNNDEDIEFSTYTVLHSYVSLINKYEQVKDKEEDLNLLKDAEPFVNSAYIALLASFMLRPDNAIGKMFNKHGFKKTQMAINDLSAKLFDIIVNYGKDNDIAPERILVALANVAKFITEPLNTSLDTGEDTGEEDILEDLLSFLSIIDSKAFKKDKKELDLNEDKISECIRKVQEGSKKANESNKNKKASTKKSANADKKESKNNDIKKLLLDDWQSIMRYLK